MALPLALEMLGTIVMVHGANGWLFTNKGGGWEYPAFWAVSLVVLFLLGDGALALKPFVRCAPARVGPAHPVCEPIPQTPPQPQIKGH